VDHIALDIEAVSLADSRPTTLWNLVADLPQFRRINTEEVNAALPYLNGVAVDNASQVGDVAAPSTT
jgi:hypothetical protein